MSSNKDILPPKINKNRGAIHPINHMKDLIMNLLSSFGFEIIDGPEIETEEFNFDMLNIKKTHPARQMHDTFYVENKSNLLRTHTSPVQIRGMLEKKPPLAFISGGKVYRKDDDATHLPMFHQIEGIVVDKDKFCTFKRFDIQNCSFIVW
jgi:phenylalanyl-tRNA synthetase alpha chain